jgi:hypothetical protein
VERKSFESSKSPDDDCENKVIHPKYYKYLTNILAHKMGFGVIVQPQPGFGMENPQTKDKFWYCNRKETFCVDFYSKSFKFNEGSY